jgi:hypothetical protein
MVNKILALAISRCKREVQALMLNQEVAIDYSKDDRSVSGQFSQRFILLQEASRKAENCGIHPSSD